MTVFKAEMFQDEDKAREALEALRWPDGPYCPHCGNSDQEKIAKVEGKKQSHRPGLYYCNDCKGQFTVTVGTVFERSKVPLTKWWMAAHLLNSSKKGISAHQVHRTIGVTYKTARFMCHRLREAMADLNPGPLGGSGKTVEADTTYIKVVIFKEADLWVAQCLDHDVCVQASDLDTVRARMRVALKAEAPLDRLPKAPEHFFKLWDRKSEFKDSGGRLFGSKAGR